MIKFCRHIRKSLLIENRSERLETDRWTVLVMEPACWVGN
jgi:hypothetical protein